MASGGRRAGSGRPKSENKKVNLPFRVYEDMIPTIKRMVLQREIDYIKCGKNYFKLFEGDYILDNGACLQFKPINDYKVYYTSKKEFERVISSYNWETEQTEKYCTKYTYKKC